MSVRKLTFAVAALLAIGALLVVLSPKHTTKRAWYVLASIARVPGSRADESDRPITTDKALLNLNTLPAPGIERPVYLEWRDPDGGGVKRCHQDSEGRMFTGPVTRVALERQPLLLKSIVDPLFEVPVPVDASLAASGSVLSLDVRLEALPADSTRATIVVVEADQTPVLGARVLTSEGDDLGTTDSQGQLTLDPAESLNVKVLKPDGRRDLQDSGHCEVRSANAALFVIQSIGTGWISVRPEHTAESVLVYLYKVSNPATNFTRWCTAGQQSVFESLAPGHYRVSGSAGSQACRWIETEVTARMGSEVALRDWVDSRVRFPLTVQTGVPPGQRCALLRRGWGYAAITTRAWTQVARPIDPGARRPPSYLLPFQAAISEAQTLTFEGVTAGTYELVPVDHRLDLSTRHMVEVTVGQIRDRSAMPPIDVRLGAGSATFVVDRTPSRYRNLAAVMHSRCEVLEQPLETAKRRIRFGSLGCGDYAFRLAAWSLERARREWVSPWMCFSLQSGEAAQLVLELRSK